MQTRAEEPPAEGEAERLLSEALAQAEEPDWPIAVQRLADAHPEQAAAIQRLFASMRAAGLVPEPAPPAPKTVGGYQLLRRIGAGGMGVVYEAQQALTGRRVALKLVRPELLESDTARRRFHREVELAASIEHPNLCTVYEAGAADGQPFLAMQLVPGRSLAAGLAGKPMPTTTAIAIVEKLARALHCAHEKGLVHRDVKPANVLLRQDGEPVLVDFGLARAIDNQQSGLTLSGELVGTPAYMAPEQIEPSVGPIDRRTDVYALGVTLFELVTGHLPFAAPTREALYRCILAGEASRTAWRGQRPSRELRAIVETALEAVPRRRYATALDLADDLARLRRHEPIRAQRAGPLLRLLRWSQRNRTAAALLAVLTAALASVAWSLQRASVALTDSRQRQLVLASVEAGRADPILALHLARAAEHQRADFAAVTQLAAAVRACSEERHLDLPFQSGAQEIASVAGNGFWCRGHDAQDLPVASVAGWSPTDGLQILTTPGPVVDLAVDPPGQRIVIADDREHVYELDADRRTWREVAAAIGAQRICFNRNGELCVGTARGELITCTAEGTSASRRTIAAGVRITALEAHADRDVLLVGTADGRLVCVPGPGGRSLDLRVNTNPRQPTQAVVAIQSGRGSPFLAARGETSQHVAVWNLDQPNTPARSFGGRQAGDPIHCFAVVGNRLATGHRDQLVRLHSLESDQVTSLTGPKGWVMKLAASEDQQLLAGVCGDGTALVWNLASDRLVHQVHGAGSSPSAVAMQPDGRRLLISSSRGPLRVYTLQHPDTPRLRGHRAGVRACLPLPTTAPHALVTAAADGTTCGWSPALGQVTFPAAGLDLVTTAAVLPTDGLVATIGTDAQLRLWTFDGKPQGDPLRLPGATGFRTRMTGLGAGRLLAISHKPDRWWHVVRSGESAYAAVDAPAGLPDPATAWGLAATADGQSLLVGHGNGTFSHLVAEGAGFQLAQRLAHAPGLGPGKCYVECVAITADGLRFLSGGTDRTAKLWHRDGTLLAKLEGHEEVLAAVAFAPDGERIATLSADEVRVWDRDGQPLFRIQTDGGAFVQCAFLADGRRLAIASTDGSVWIEPVRLEDLRELAAQRETRETAPEVLAPYAELLGESVAR